MEMQKPSIVTQKVFHAAAPIGPANSASDAAIIDGLGKM